MRAPPSLFRRAVRLAGKGLLGATGVCTATTVYVYNTDESWRRCIDFNMSITPLCWDYYRDISVYSDTVMTLPLTVTLS